ncbi:acyltransferase family protein [Paraconexibacter algicola]|nr:acyltransferase [Paraconexibacter algicola]
MTHQQFRTTRYFAPLDGLRAVSIALVLVAHSGDRTWDAIHGSLGVALFFVISGFLITTLLLREEDRNGRVSLRAFWIRRAYRILPLYLLALAVFTVARLGLGLGEGQDDYVARLVYFVTFTNELAPDGTFGHSWSLGVEEKFYLLWPLLAFAATAGARHRGAAVTALVVAALTGWLVDHGSYLALYLPIFLGCGLALVLHDPRGFAVARRLASPAVGLSLVAVAIVGVFVFAARGNVQVGYGLVAVWAFPAVLLGVPGVTRGLTSRPLVHIGTRSYAIYLFHPLVGEVVDRVLAPDRGTATATMRLALLLGGSLVVAELLHRTVERPLIRRGRTIAARATRPSPAPSALVPTPEP